jgi:eukaryotic-like serine/threonine-protein kinase
VTRPYTNDRGPDDEAPWGRVVLDERYELIELLGRGGMAEVHRARDRELGRVVAVKLLPSDRRDDDTDARRLREEARSAAVLSHPHVIAVHDVGTSPHGVYVVMELIDGRTWADELREKGGASLLESVRIGAAIASALAHAHSHGIVHRDVNPGNVMLLGDGTPKLMDFGIAKTDDVGGLTETGRVVGTAAYMSPEQVRGETLDGRSDVYSLGCTLYEVLTGIPPFRGVGSADVASARLREPPVPLRQVRSTIPVPLEDAVLRARSRDPQHRPDAAALSETLDELGDRYAVPSPAEAATEVVSVQPTTDESSRTTTTVSPGLDTPTRGTRMRLAGMALLVLGALALIAAVVVLLVLG